MRAKPSGRALRAGTATCLLLALFAGPGCAREAEFVKRMHQHDARLRTDRVDYEAELQDARRRQDEQASLH